MKAILFDLYGTLIDIRTDEESSSFWKSVFRIVKKYWDDTPEVLKSRYKQICKSKQLYKEEIDILEVFQDLLHISRDIAQNIAWKFRKASIVYIRIYDGVKKLLKRLKTLGYKLYILSNAQEAFTLPELKKFHLIHYFDGIAISSEYGVKKPNTEFFQKAIQNFGLDKEIWMVGNDVECDILPAKAIGLKTIFIQSNLTPMNQEKDKIIGFDYKLLYEKIIRY